MKKYEFTGDTKDHYGITLKRIRALVTIVGVVSAGDAGGWVADEKNLSQTGNAWVSGDARVYGDARVSGNARVYGNARVSGNALVYGNARVSGNALVYGDARVSGNARVYGNAAICFFGGFGSENRQTTAFIDSKLGVRIVCGCFSGSLEEFRAKVEKTHGADSRHGKLYLGMANMIEFRLGEVQP